MGQSERERDSLMWINLEMAEPICLSIDLRESPNVQLII